MVLIGRVQFTGHLNMQSLKGNYKVYEILMSKSLQKVVENVCNKLHMSL